MRRCADLRFLACALAALAGLAALGARRIEAHKWVTSPYTYTDDIFPILRDRCGACHVEDGPAPMGLLSWNDGPNSAAPWAESIRLLIIDEQMPPWYVDPTGPAMRGGSPLSALESDKLLSWVTGGTPKGDLDRVLPEVAYRAGWRGPAPDLELPMAAEHVMPAGANEETREFVIPTGLDETRWVRGVDLLAGAPAIVRNATIALDDGTVLAVWVPGGELVPAPSGAAFRLPAGADLHLEIHYKKQWQTQGEEMRDRSTVGLYFTDPPVSGRAIESVAIDAPAEAGGEDAAPAPFSGELAANARVVAVRPSLDQVYGAFAVDAVTPSGARVPLLKLRLPRPEWRRRYWLAEPVELPAGSRIEVTRELPPGHVDLIGARLMKTYPLQVALDYVPLE